MSKHEFGKRSTSMWKYMKRTHHTDSGILCIWDYEFFKHIHDYDSWDKELCEDEDISRNVSKSVFVPLNPGDGAFEVEVRFDKNHNLTDREQEYLLVPSRPLTEWDLKPGNMDRIKEISGKISAEIH